jgi:hypothetical protein
MKKTFLFVILIAAMQPVFAQTLKLDIRGGLNESTADFGTSSSTSSFTTGFNAGIFADIKWNRVSIEPGLCFTAIGYIAKTTASTVYPDEFYASGTVALRYLQVPLNALYGFPVKKFKIFVGGGPYWGFALSGTTTVRETVNGGAVVIPDQDASFGKNGNFSNSDYGLNALAGISLKNGLTLNVDYGYGLANIASNITGTIKNRVLSASLGYEFL